MDEKDLHVMDEKDEVDVRKEAKYKKYIKKKNYYVNIGHRSTDTCVTHVEFKVVPCGG